jgi:hypothetical protein
LGTELTQYLTNCVSRPFTTIIRWFVSSRS